MQPEDAVRLYLMFLADPQSLRDEHQIEQARAAVEHAKDPVDRLKAINRLKLAEQVDGSSFRNDFIAQAKAYADAENILPESFLEMGVPREDLAAAGLDLAGERRRSAGTAATPRKRAPRVSSDDVRAAALDHDHVFTVNELVERTGASLGTVRRVIQELVDEGRLKDVGEDPDWGGRGRAPIRYDNS